MERINNENNNLNSEKNYNNYKKNRKVEEKSLDVKIFEPIKVKNDNIEEVKKTEINKESIKEINVVSQPKKRKSPTVKKIFY